MTPYNNEYRFQAKPKQCDEDNGDHEVMLKKVSGQI